VSGLWAALLRCKPEMVSSEKAVMYRSRQGRAQDSPRLDLLQSTVGFPLRARVETWISSLDKLRLAMKQEAL
jgi:hypothetical protein